MDHLPKSLAELPVSEPRWVGRSVPRVEDPMLVTGQVEFIADVRLPDMVHCAIARSPHAHARIRAIDTSRAEALPGVAAVISGEDARRWSQPLVGVPQGWGALALVRDRARYVGEPVAAVAARSRALAEDALELIEIDYEPLPPIVDALEAVRPGSPRVNEEHASNIMLHRVFEWGDVDEAARKAHRVFRESFRCHRLGANPLETFGVISQWHPREGCATIRGSYQVPGFMALGIAGALGLAPSQLRLISHPHGGSFGGKGGTRGSVITALLSRKAGGRPVRWIEDRSEYLLAGGSQAWDRHYRAALMVDADGRVTAFDVELIDDLGASGENSGAVSAVRPIVAFTGCYAIPAARYDLTLVATNKLPQSAYRGMGLTPHNFVLEQMMDIAARALELDPVEIRRRNYIPADRFPYTIVSGNRYDSGRYADSLETALEDANYAGLRQRQAAARARGRLVGIGVVNTVEPGVFSWNIYSAVLGSLPGTGVPEGVRIGFDLAGKLMVRVGFPLEGQGQYTFVTQLLADYFGLELADVRVVMEDTLSAPPHFGPGGSRLAVALSGAVLGAADLLRKRLLRVAAVLLRCEPDEVELMDGSLRLKTGRGASLSLPEVVAVLLTRSDLLPEGVEPSAEATYVWVAPGQQPPDDQGRTHSYLTTANSCHVVMVEIDRETGQVEIQGYWAVDDCGQRLNPAIVDGMIEGGMAQGVGATLLEEYVFDSDGQPQSTTFADYLLPTIHEVPAIQKTALVTPSPFTPLGAKGMGEAAMLTTQAALMSAINDALSPLGVCCLETPATPQRLWRLMRG